MFVVVLDFMGVEIVGYEYQGVVEMVGVFVGSDLQQVVVEYVEQCMDYFWVGFFQFVEENDVGVFGIVVQFVLF